MTNGHDIEHGTVSTLDEPQWHVLSEDEVYGLMNVSTRVRLEGLTADEVQKRREKYGLNQLSEKEKVSLLKRIWKQVGNVLVGILAFVAVVSLIKGITSSGESRVTNLVEFGLIVFVIM